MSYTIQPGDTLFKIATPHGISLGQLEAVNPGINPALIFPGQSINLPSAGGIYSIKEGDSLYSIPQAAGISLDDLIAANPGVDRTTILQIGQKLNVPAPSPGIGSGGARTAGGNADETAALAIHNKARRECPGGPHPDLTWDGDLARQAQKYAQYLASNRLFEHSHTQGQGENLYRQSPSCDLAKGAQVWVDERQNYHGQKIGEPEFPKYGHYTQCIWRSTQRVGMGSADGPDGTVVVGRYMTPGNFSGQSAW